MCSLSFAEWSSGHLRKMALCTQEDSKGEKKLDWRRKYNGLFDEGQGKNGKRTWADMFGYQMLYSETWAKTVLDFRWMALCMDVYPGVGGSTLDCCCRQPNSVETGIMKSPVLRSTSFLSRKCTLMNVVNLYQRRHHHFRLSDLFFALHCILQLWHWWPI